MTSYKVSIDIGGTFTDLVALDETNGNLFTIKIPSTPQDPALGFLEILKEFLTNADPSAITIINHATTLAVNALLGQVGLELPKVASISTEGFRDILEIGRQRRHELYNLNLQKPQTLVPRHLRFEVKERVDAKGKILQAIEPHKVRSLASQLQKQAVEAVAITLLFSYASPGREQTVERILRKHIPSLCISRSSEIAPEQREYERTSTTIINACLMPIISSYLQQLTKEIAQLGVNAPVCIMRSDGGIAKKEIVMKKPACLIESGPAAGVVASSFYAGKIGMKNILSFDMGGTTAKAGTIQAGKPQVVTEYEVAGKIHSGRIIKGSGYPVKFPFIDLAECSAGGGTIAWTDETGALKVGPMSAGATPGPACYGKGGKKPTVTDANLLLGRLNPTHMLNGEMPIFANLSKESLQKEVCQKIGINLETAAMGIIKVVNSQMSKILRMVSIERGLDPRKFTLVSFGGAGPMHSCALAEQLLISRIMVPQNPGLFSAQGLLAPDFSSDFTQAIFKKSAEIGNKLEETFETLESKAVQTLTSQGVRTTDIRFHRQLDMRYSEQSYELTIPISSCTQEQVLNQSVEDFHKKHKAVYGYRRDEEMVEIVNARLKAIGLVKKPPLRRQKLEETNPLPDAVAATRGVFFEESDRFEVTTVYSREKLKNGNFFKGPAVVEQYDATTVIYPKWQARIDEFGNLILTLEED